MTYLYWYLGVGVIILAIIMAAHNYAKKKEGNNLNDFLVELRKEGKSFWFRMLNDLIGPMFAFVLVLPFWPIIVFFKIKQVIVGEPEQSSFEEPEFIVTREDLLARIDVSEIEKKEMVADPMGAVPNLPFGHLHTAWRQFRDGVLPTDEMWTFAAKWTHWGRSELRQGYAVVREDDIGPFFLTSWKEIDDDRHHPAKDSGSHSFDMPLFRRRQEY